MPNHDLDSLLATLADPTRRAVIERLSQGPAAVKELAGPHGMSLPAFLQHLGVLERVRLIRTAKEGRQRICRLEPAALAPLAEWLARQRAVWEARGDRLAGLAERIDRERTPDGAQE
ncbi:ArsR/SmtB family transcription factor [Oceaniglobus roseus]|uniref:ArsR/SmtB family transcription factor n=1 Tax=Oceaniglobus roseus TaxID=1737570 RepID=UPI000C7F0DE8|nr:metalloregulator ArsR/SmtB family transcription factor [Kandeliimicrobium roseum]